MLSTLVQVPIHEHLPGGARLRCSTQAQQGTICQPWHTHPHCIAPQHTQHGAYIDKPPLVPCTVSESGQVPMVRANSPQLRCVSCAAASTNQCRGVNAQTAAWHAAATSRLARAALLWLWAMPGLMPAAHTNAFPAVTPPLPPWSNTGTPSADRSGLLRVSGPHSLP
jgi:hypothetical protein